jgi:1,4-dihydroxy-2-naphthoate octaprenyltransferase
MDAKTLFLATRPWSFTMTFSSVTLGTLVAYLGGSFNLLLYLLTLGGMIAFHAATNLINDYYDVKHGVDKMGAPTTKYRPHPLAAGVESPQTIRSWAAVFYALTLLTAAYLSWARNPWVVAIVIVGVAASFLYTADPVVLKAKGLGEVTVFLMWGPLIPLGAYAVQTQTLSVLPAIIAVPVGLFVALVLLANNIRDVEYDGSVQTKTLPVMVGKKSGIVIYDLLLLIAYLPIPMLIIAGLLSPWSLLVLLTVPEALGLWRMLKGPVPDNADPRTAGLALKYSILYMMAFILQIAFPLHVFI